MSIPGSSGFRVGLAVGLLGVAGLSLAATGGEGTKSSACLGCPHSGIKTEPSQFKFGPMIECGGGVVFSQSGLTITSPQGKCPTVVIFESKRDVPTPKRGFRTVLDGTVPVREFKMHCGFHLPFGWFPIPIGTKCAPDGGGTTISQLRNYAERACDEAISVPAEEVK